ncbi:MAG: SusD/RagB family nutrient-binding outer membrane lipoprotein, partial [Bacteroidales bacterium]|nr:SusD/RagB family nutrient-binding outer membrane lipoprotein [Bacteroidales bacterium]
MKKIFYILLSICTFCIGSSCVDDFNEVNKDPNKIYMVTPQHVFPGVVHNTLNYTAELNHKFFAWQARYVHLWPSPKDTEDMSGIYRDIYMKIVNNLEKLADVYVDAPESKNASCMIMTWKAYIYSLLAGSFGGVPMSTAATEQLDNVYMYDSEYDMYVQILDLLEKAVFGFDSGGDKLQFDPLFRNEDNTSDIVRWRKFANTLYLDIALRVQNMDEELAKKHIKKSLEHADWFVSSVNDIVKMKWGTDLNQDASYYYRSFLRR